MAEGTAAKAATCAVCGAAFPSRNKLFRHLKDSGHGAAGATWEGAGARDGDEGAAAKDVTSSADRRNDSSGEQRLAKGNEAYREYYRRQKICNSDEEWGDAYDRLRRPLALSYRMHISSPLAEFAAELLALVERRASTGEQHRRDSADSADSEEDGGNDKSAFQQWSFGEQDTGSIPRLRMMITPQFHRRSKNRSKGEKSDGSPMLHALQELGAIHRQELVSAIPPLVLWAASSNDKSRNDALIIADMCAAPGSKSLQLLDLLYTNSDSTQIPSGLLVVNDSDRKRIVTLCQRTRHVPRAPMLAICTDGRYFPGIRRRCNWSGSANEGAQSTILEKAGYKQKYDGVLCDVPCSGDGTARKNGQVWNDWSMSQAMSLHRLQRKILRRGMELLRPGGFLVYSTCSLNPLENEAVVASVIGDVGGVSSMEIVPLPEWLVEKCKPQRGLSAWQVPHPKFGKKGNADMYQCFADVPKEHQGGSGKERKGGQVNQSMFPPEIDAELSSQLSYCGRFLPNSRLDSGGFFVACIKRLHVGELGTKERSSTANSSAPNTSVAEEATTGVDSSNEGEQPKEPAQNETREGDWICSSCKELNFGRRGASRCFGCKARKPKPKTKEDKISPPLLMVQSSMLDSFVAFFGIESGPESAFPTQNVRIIRRVKEHTIVLVSDALAKLAISESWGPLREVGISLAAFPSPSDGKGSPPAEPEFRLLSEGLAVLTQHATRRHLKLQPTQFRISLAQCVQSLLKSSPEAEVERVKGTLGQSMEVVDTLCGSNYMWYESLQDESMASMWKECKASPGYFIVSCECKFPHSKGSTLAFCGCIDLEGKMAVKTSLRVAAAMLVLLNDYHAEVVLASNDDPPTKRRRT